MLRHLGDGTAESPITLDSESESGEDDEVQLVGENGQHSKKRPRPTRRTKKLQEREARRFRRIQPCVDSSSDEDMDKKPSVPTNGINDGDTAKPKAKAIVNPVTPKKKLVSLEKEDADNDIDNNNETRELPKLPQETSLVNGSKEQGDTETTLKSTTDNHNQLHCQKQAPSELGSEVLTEIANQACQNQPLDDDIQQNVKDLKNRSRSQTSQTNSSDEEEDGSSESESGSLSTSSASISDAENPLNAIEFHEDPINTSPEDDTNTSAINFGQVPIGVGPVRHKKVEIQIHSAQEFSLEVFTERHTTQRRIPMYPREIAIKFCSLPTTSQRFEDGRFFFKMSLNTFQYIKNVIAKVWVLDSFKRQEYEGLERVVHALVKYHHVMDKEVLDKLGHKFAELRVNEFEDLRPYQRESILFAHSRQGRCMLADASGMGKRVEAIVTCYLFEEDWPVIIVCATAQQEHWVALLQEWLPDERKYSLVNLETPEDLDEYPPDDKPPDFTIIGYTLLGKEAKRLKEIDFKIAIIDESHKIKHAWTATTKAAKQIIKRAKRRLLLTSNPAFGVPDELFCQLHVIDRETFKDSQEFAQRYCGLEKRPDKYGRVKEFPSRNWRHAKNLDELKHLLHNTVIVRHLKSHDAYIRQPEKNRKLVKLDFQPDERTKAILGEIYADSKLSLDDLMTFDGEQKKAKVFTWYKKSGKAKMNLICKYLDQFDLSHRKTIIYARHMFVLNGIELLLQRKGIKYVRIQGDYENRTDLSDEFDEDDETRVALLSLNISQVGVNLTKADTVIFAELYWVPDSILRNEDRAWEFFQSTDDNCDGPSSSDPEKLDIIYLIASDLNTNDMDKQVHMDLHLWEMLQGKISILMKLGLMEDDFTATTKEEIFVPVITNNEDDLKFSDVSSNESDHEFVVEEEELESEAESESGSSPVASEDLSPEDDEINDDSGQEATPGEPEIEPNSVTKGRTKSTTHNTSHSSECSADDAKEDTNAARHSDSDKSGSSQSEESELAKPPRRKMPTRRRILTRSQDKVSTSTNASRRKAEKGTDTSNSSADSDSDSFVVPSSDEEEASRSRKSPPKKQIRKRKNSGSKPTKPQKGKGTNRRSQKPTVSTSTSEDEESDEETSENSESDSESESSGTYERQVKKFKRSFVN